MIKGLITVIIPIYNVKKYLDKCIDSVVNQTYSDLEIILVDDGSTDGSSSICDERAKSDSRIKVIHKANQGLGMARNTGIENADGEYICFFDSDDFIAPETIEKSYKAAVKNKSQIVLFGINFTDSEGNVVEKFVSPLGEINYNGSCVQNEFLPEFIAADPKGNGIDKFYMSPCLMLYSMELINSSGWRFVSEREIISEDVYSLISLFKHVKSVSVVPEAFYYYRKNTASLSRVFREDRFDKLNHFYLETKKLCSKLGYDDEIIHRVTTPYLSFVISAMKQESIADRPKRENVSRIKEIVNNDIFRSVLEIIKNDKMSFSRRLLFFTVRNRLSLICYFLLKKKAEM